MPRLELKPPGAALLSLDHTVAAQVLAAKANGSMPASDCAPCSRNINQQGLFSPR